ncbi:MAG: hypothetical protein NZ922_03310 [Candidatus Methanomethyliaceae archaeon]|nr:hypothetical protein [Candidatus Methanomethyliaceae archaeon]MDW7970535.1 hypothetical protein [Nitrososphaerota archaeon]
MKIIAIPIASSLHRREFYEEIFNLIKSKFIGIEVLNIVEDEINNELIMKLENSMPIIIVLTGGVSNLAMRIIKRSKIKRAILISHSKHNSLASALSIKSKAEGIMIRNYFFKRSEDLDFIVKITEALNSLLGIRVGLISEELSEYVDKFKEKLNAEVLLIGYDELNRDVEEEEINTILKFISNKIDLTKADKKLLERTIKLYLIIKKIMLEKKLNGIAIDCFPYLIKYGVTPCLAVSLLNDDGLVAACEADLRSLLLMLIAKAIGKNSWMANVASINGKEITLAHCTISTKLTNECKLLNHFESGLPYSLACTLKGHEFTMVGINREFSKIAALKVKLLRSGLLDENMCRTQAIFEAPIDLGDFPNMALSNHHVIIHNNVINELKELAHLLSMDFTTYDKSFYISKEHYAP